MAVDGNGTLLRGDGTVSEYTRDVVQRVEALGIPVVLATGRPFEKATEFGSRRCREAVATLESCGMRHFVLTENGARAVRISEGRAVWETWLEGPEVAEMLARVKARHLKFYNYLN